MDYGKFFPLVLKAMFSLSVTSFRFTVALELLNFQQLDKGLIILLSP